MNNKLNSILPGSVAAEPVTITIGDYDEPEEGYISGMGEPVASSSREAEFWCLLEDSKQEEDSDAAISVYLKIGGE